MKHSIDELREMTCNAIDKFVEEEKEVNERNIEYLHLLTDTYKNDLKIDMLERAKYEIDDSGAYGRGGYAYDGGRGSYDGGGYSRHDGGYAYRRGYSRDDGGSYRRGYSRDDGRDQMVQKMTELINDAPTMQEKEVLRNAMERMYKN